MCEFALNLTGNLVHKEAVPARTWQQLIATWVKAKQLLRQPIGLDVGEQVPGSVVPSIREPWGSFLLPAANWPLSLVSPRAARPLGVLPTLGDALCSLA